MPALIVFIAILTMLMTVFIRSYVILKRKELQTKVCRECRGPTDTLSDYGFADHMCGYRACYTCDANSTLLCIFSWRQGCCSFAVCLYTYVVHSWCEIALIFIQLLIFHIKLYLLVLFYLLEKVYFLVFAVCVGLLTDLMRIAGDIHESGRIVSQNCGPTTPC